MTKQLALIAGFLENKTDSDFVANVHLDSGHPAADRARKLLVTEMGCAVCHEINGIPQARKFRSRL